MATNLPVPDASVRLTLEDGRPNPDWYRILSRLIGLFNDTTASLDDTSTGLGTKLSQGLHTIWVPAGAMVPRETNGPELVTTELATNDVMLRTLDFDQTTVEATQFQIAMPKSWDEGTVSFVPYWTAASGTGGVVWNLRALARSNDDPIDAAFGSQIFSLDTLIAANDLHIGPESGAVTIGGTPAENDLVIFELERTSTNGSDTLTADAKLIGVKVLYTVAAGNDA